MDSPTALPRPASTTPSQTLQASSRRTSFRNTARQSVLGLFALWGNQPAIQETEENEPTSDVRRTIIDPFPPRIGSLDLPRLDVNLQSPRSPASVRSAANRGGKPDTTRRPTSFESVRTVHSQRSRRSQRSQRVRSIQSVQSSEQSLHLPIQAPARSLDYGGNLPANPATQTQAEDQLPYRHPADPLPAPAPASPHRHPADALPSRAMSADSAASHSSGHMIRRKRRRRGQRQNNMPRNRFVRRFFPALRYHSVRRKVLHTLITGALMLLVFIIFLALMNSTNDFAQEFRIITILFMLIFVVLFAHSMIRLMVLLLRLRRNGGLVDPDDDDPDSYAQVSEPIPVVLARDEELGLSNTQAPESNKDVPPPPPAYGRWRGSVRVDPNLIHWERANPGERPLSEGTLRRPPSYGIEEQPDESQEDAAGNADELNEKPIRPRTPPVEQNRSSRRRPMVLYDATQSWAPQTLQ